MIDPDQLLVLCAIGIPASFIVVAAKVNQVARRAERIYIARHRDHSKVPPIRGRDVS